MLDNPNRRQVIILRVLIYCMLFFVLNPTLEQINSSTVDVLVFAVIESLFQFVHWLKKKQEREPYKEPKELKSFRVSGIGPYHEWYWLIFFIIFGIAFLVALPQ